MIDYNRLHCNKITLLEYNSLNLFIYVDNEINLRNFLKT